MKTDGYEESILEFEQLINQYKKELQKELRISVLLLNLNLIFMAVCMFFMGTYEVVRSGFISILFCTCIIVFLIGQIYDVFQYIIFLKCELRSCDVSIDNIDKMNKFFKEKQEELNKTFG